MEATAAVRTLKVNKTNMSKNRKAEETRIIKSCYICYQFKHFHKDSCHPLKPKEIVIKSKRRCQVFYHCVLHIKNRCHLRNKVKPKKGPSAFLRGGGVSEMLTLADMGGGGLFEMLTSASILQNRGNLHQ